MRSTRLRLAALSSGVAVLALLGTAHGATTSTGPKTLTITDDKGDEKGGQAAMDITSVVVTTTGKTVTKIVRGKKVNSYTPDTLVFTMNLAAPPTPAPFALYEMHAMTSECGDLWLYYDGQDLFSGSQVDCGSPEDATGSTATTLVDPVVQGSSIVWTIPFSALPKREMRVGTSMTDFHAYVAAGEPVEGISTEVLLPTVNPDNADSGAVYKIG